METPKTSRYDFEIQELKTASHSLEIWISKDEKDIGS